MGGPEISRPDGKGHGGLQGGCSGGSGLASAAAVLAARAPSWATEWEGVAPSGLTRSGLACLGQGANKAKVCRPPVWCCFFRSSIPHDDPSRRRRPWGCRSIGTASPDNPHYVFQVVPFVSS